MSLRFLGVDGGGTKTEAVIVDEGGRVLGRGLGPSCNLDDHPAEEARRALTGAIQAARFSVGYTGGFDAAFLGLSGTVSPEDRQAAAAMIAPLHLAPASRLSIDHDARAALAGGLSLAPGLVLVAGTGSVCFGMDDAGHTARVGGHGPLLGDEGSAYWLGLEGLKAALHSADGLGVPSSLERMLLAPLGLTAWDSVLHRVHKQGLGRGEIAALAPLVLGAAEQRDAVALRIASDGAKGLAELVAAAQRRLNGPLSVVAACGGALLGSALYFALTQHALGGATELVRPARSPAEGAALLAVQQFGIHSSVRQALK